MQNLTFSLTDNAFFILGAKYDTNRSEIAELVEEAEFDQQYSTDLIQRAQQSLLAPMARLDEEVSWLPTLSEIQIKNILDLIEVNRFDKLNDLSNHLPELARVNILSHLISKSYDVFGASQRLIETWDDIDKQEVLASLNSQRRASGFPVIERHALDAALNLLENKHASSAAKIVEVFKSPSNGMHIIVKTALKTYPYSPLLEKLVRNYDGASEAALSNISSAIDSFIDSARTEGKDLNATVGEISSLLARWNEISLPVQVYEQYQGHEEARSKEIYERLRELCLYLANECGKYSEAKRISETLLKSFIDLETVAEILKQDIEKLNELEKTQRNETLIEPLIIVCQTAKDELTKVRKSLSLSGFSDESKGPVRDIVIAFRNASALLEDNSVLFLIIRDLALYINNECQDPETAFKLLDGLLNFQHPKNDLYKQLEEECAVSYRNWKMNELQKSAGNWGAMLQIIEDLLKKADDEDQIMLQELRAKIKHKHFIKKVKWGFFALVAIIIIANAM